MVDESGSDGPLGIGAEQVVRCITAQEAAPAHPVAQALIALNNAHAEELSHLETPRLQTLVLASFAAWRVGEADALLLAFDQDAAYDSRNFLWFRARLTRFVYIDRVVVAPHARGRGHATALYQRLFSQAARSGHDRVVCEVNIDPPNPISDAFHARLGFAGVGSAVVSGGPKLVRYLSRPLTQAVA